MTIDTAARKLAEYMREHDHIRIIGHYDADGIAAASIICHALLRNGTGFHLTFRSRLSYEELYSLKEPLLLCDLGSSYEELPEGTMVIDHHLPKINGEFHVNPRLCKLDGEFELSSSGAAYFVAQHLGDNRDLAGLAVAGMIGDHQHMAGKNYEILNEGIANGFITADHGLLLPGRDTGERIKYAIHPYLNGLSGRDPDTTGLDILSGEKEILSATILKTGDALTEEKIRMLYGDRFMASHEDVEDLHTLTAIINACGKSGSADTAAAICLRTGSDVKEGWEITRTFRMKVIRDLENARSIALNGASAMEVDSPETVSEIADIIAYEQKIDEPIFVISYKDGQLIVSGRYPPDADTDLGNILESCAKMHGGDGGGHRLRAGANVPDKKKEVFFMTLEEAIAS